MSEKTNLQFWNGFRFQLQLLTDSVLLKIACQSLFHFWMNDTTTTNILQFAHDLSPFTYLTLRSDAPSESSGFYVLHPEPFDISHWHCSLPLIFKHLLSKLLDLMSLVNLLVQFALSKTLWPFFHTYLKSTHDI